jgi:hypothetical protein
MGIAVVNGMQLEFDSRNKVSGGSQVIFPFESRYVLHGPNGPFGISGQ